METITYPILSSDVASAPDHSRQGLLRTTVTKIGILTMCANPQH